MSERAINIGEVWKTRGGGYPVHVVDDMFCGPFPLLGRIDFSVGHQTHWAFSRDGRSADPVDTGFDLVERIFPVPDQANA